MRNALLDADCVWKSFRGRRVLSSASLRAVPGEVCALLGRNGSGKSTLLKIAAGWLEPDAGAVRWESRRVAGARPAALARAGMFYLPDRDLLSSAVSVRTQLEWLQRRFDGGNPRAALELAGVAQSSERRPHELSGGERRRVELAAVLVRRPRCLLADEPYRGIAPHDADVVTRVLRELVMDHCAVVVTGHEVPTMMDVADRVTWCTNGTTHDFGSPADAMRHDAFRREYLGR